MLPSAKLIFAPLAVFTSLQSYVQAAPNPLPPRSVTDTEAAAPPDICSGNATVQDLWSIKGLTVTYVPDLTKGSGTGAFTLTNTRTNYSEALKCNLRANYLCDYQGTPGDPGLSIWLQLNLDIAYITINQSWACGDSEHARTAFAVGVAEVTLTCPQDFYEKSLPCTGTDDEGLASGVVTVPTPAPAAPTSSPSPSKRQKRGHPMMPHMIESTTTTIPAKKPATRPNKYHPPGNLDLRKKTWQALATTLGRRRNGNSRGSKSSASEQMAESSGPEIPVGPYPLPKQMETRKKKKTEIKVDIEHLCSPSCRGGPKPPSWDLKGQHAQKPGRRRGASRGRPVVLEVM